MPLIDRPLKKNALIEAMHAALADGLEAEQGDPQVRVVLLRGAGDLFCAGH